MLDVRCWMFIGFIEFIGFVEFIGFIGFEGERYRVRGDQGPSEGRRKKTNLRTWGFGFHSMLDVGRSMLDVHWVRWVH